MLAAIIWHEMAHLQGAPEPEAQRREQELWTTFIRDRRVDQTVGLRYLLVQSQDWKPMLRRVGKNPECPAFTLLDKRQTFLEDALFQSDASRSRTLLLRYRVPLDQILRFAVIHELAHAVCREADEPRAIALAGQLRTTGTVVCGG